MLKAHSRLFEHLTLLGDLLLITGSWVLAYYLRFFLGPIPVYQGTPPLGPYLVLVVPIAVVWAVAFRAFGLYRPRRLKSRLAEWIDIAKASSLGCLVLVAVMEFFFRSFEFSRLVILYFWVLSVVSVSLSRAVFREALRFARRRGYNLRYALIVGSGELARTVVERLGQRPDVGLQVAGLVGDEKDATDSAVKRLGGYGDLRSVMERLTVDRVILALPHEDYARLPLILDEIGDDPVAIHFVPDFLRFASLRGGVEEFEGLPFIHLRESPLHGWNLVLKRGFDLTFGSLALLLAAPLMLLIALAIRFTSGAPVLYRQERMGLDGQRFWMLKFRTMQLDAEAETGPVWASPGDPRRTRLGTLLRSWSLDELPQLFNVLKGEMSLVGPRPERPVFVEQFRREIPGYMLRHKVKSGITGWAQVKGWRGDIPLSSALEWRIEYDLEYIERWSLLFDLNILWLTLWNGFRNRNAY
ncbi:MAG: undecaprenyl-phosphate glucose phosphotransferase [Candidatus Rokubacteria bacterium]|nr:undecaprenyl-phosphate glucose phosphotransferase [Candidatus Rokubacteria bacterium]